MPSSPSIVALVALLLPPLLLNAALRLHWSSFLWATPLLLFIWSLFLVVAYLFACHVANVKSASSSHHVSDQLRSLPRLAFLTQAAWSAQRTRLKWAREPHSAASSLHTSHDTASLSYALDDVIQLILRDFVCKWHTPLASGSEDPSINESAPEFPEAVKHTLRDALHRLASLSSRIDHADLVVRKLMPRITAHIHSYRKAEIDFRGASAHTHLANFGSDQSDLFLARKFEDGHLHPAVGDMSNAKKPDQKSFDAFLKSIRSASSLLEVRRTKNDIAVQIRKTKFNLERASDDSHDASRAKLQSYLHRLDTAHSIAEQRIAQLSVHKGVPNVSSKASAGADPNASRVKLHDVLLNPSSLSIFMEFMDRRKRSILVQFWMLVESFKNPLEDSDADPLAEREQRNAAARADPPSRAAVQTLKEDLRMFDSVYYSSPAIKVSQEYIDSARQFLDASDDAPITALHVWRVRRDVLRAQKQVYQEIEDEDWPSFREGNLFIKAAQDLNPNPHLAAGLASSVGSLSADPQPRLHKHAAASAEVAQRPVIRPSKPSFEHADLFGTDTPIGPEAKHSDLFGDSLGGSRSKASAKSDNLDILIGGRTQHVGPDGRTPLFREDPLFDEADEPHDDQLAEDHRGDSSSDFIHVEKIDELQTVLQSIIDDDLSKSGNRQPFASLGPSAAKTARFAIDAELSNGSDTNGPHRKAGDAGNATTLAAENKTRNEDGSPHGAPTSIGNLPQEVRRLDMHLEKLEAQAEILDALARKAELTGARSSEMRLLAQSVQAVRREARDTRWQRNQLEQQLAATQLIPGHTKISIQDTMISTDDEGKEFAVYLIEIGITEPGAGRSRGAAKSADGSPTARGWIVGRRYSEFWSLHQSLKERFAEVRALESDFPGKRLVGLVHAPFVDARKAALERYLQALVKLRVACESEELRHFLSQTPSTPISSLDMRVAEDGGHAMDKNATPAELREAAGAGTTYWTEPICDLFTEVFELHEKNNWLRRQAIVILLQQLFGSTVERKIRETFITALAPPSLTNYVATFKASLWPKGVLKEPTPPRTAAEKDALRENANSKLASLIPELAANFVGRENARKGTRRVFSALQNKRLNKHLVYSLFDIVVDELLAAADASTADSTTPATSAA
ncbi:hypothetical protein L1887_63501 [Cichorium endivia]|nr:hypothetical protein L1887_63501 [Cichorium endivia]